MQARQPEEPGPALPVHALQLPGGRHVLQRDHLHAVGDGAAQDGADLGRLAEAAVQAPEARV